MGIARIMLSSESACCPAGGQTPPLKCGGILQSLKLPLMKGRLCCAGGNRTKPQRPDYKFNKKPKRAKARSSGNDGGGYDGAAFTTGKRGGLVRPSG